MEPGKVATSQGQVLLHLQQCVERLLLGMEWVEFRISDFHSTYNVLIQAFLGQTPGWEGPPPLAEAGIFYSIIMILPGSSCPSLSHPLQGTLTTRQNHL